MSLEDGALAFEKSNIDKRLVVGLLIVSVHGVMLLLNGQLPILSISELQWLIAMNPYHLQVIFWIHLFSMIFCALTPKVHIHTTKAFVAGALVVIGSIYLVSPAPIYGLLMGVNGLGMVAEEYTYGRDIG